MFHLHKLNLSTLSLEPGTSGIYPRTHTQHMFVTHVPAQDLSRVVV